MTFSVWPRLISIGLLLFWRWNETEHVPSGNLTSRICHALSVSACCCLEDEMKPSTWQAVMFWENSGNHETDLWRQGFDHALSASACCCLEDEMKPSMWQAVMFWENSGNHETDLWRLGFDHAVSALACFSIRIKWNRVSDKRFCFHKIGMIMTQYYDVFWPHLIRPCLFVKSNMCCGYGKTDNKKPATCFATLLQNELNNDVARFTTHVQTCLATKKVVNRFEHGCHVLSSTHHTNQNSWPFLSFLSVAEKTGSCRDVSRDLKQTTTTTTAVKTSLNKWICVFSNFITSIWNCSIRKI